MCGICGWVDFGADPSAPDLDGTLRAMTRTMSCCGPDSSALWAGGPAALGRRGPEVADAVGRGRAATPDDDGPPLYLVYAGEIHNHRELRAELWNAGHRLRTSGDPEVVLRAHREWGRRDAREAARRLNGGYAYAIWDPRARELTLVRDRLGIAPLYYHPTPHGVIFGSRPAAILANPAVRPVVDREGLRRALSWGVADPSNAVFRGMREVPPGTVLRVSPSGIREERYWRLAGTGHTDDVGETVARVRLLLDDAVARRTVPHAPPGTLLSGDPASSALAALAGPRVRERSASPMPSFSVDIAGPGEDAGADGPFARHVAGLVGTEHHDVRLPPEELDAPAVRAAVLAARDRPVGPVDADASLYLLFRWVREHCTVVLSGAGADEVFGHDPGAAGTFPWPVRDPADTGFVDRTVFGRIDVAGYAEDLYRTALAEVPELSGPAARDPLERRMREVSYLGLTRRLPILLERAERMGAAAGVRVRAPFCDHRLVEYVFGVPWSHKVSDGRPGSLLRDAMRGLLPGSVLYREKGQGPRGRDDASAGRGLRERAAALLAQGDSAPVAAFLDVPALRAWIDAPAGAVGRCCVRHALGIVLDLNRWLAEHRADVDV